MIDEHEMRREKVALEVGFKLYLPYAEKVAAALIRRDLSTLKRWRRAGKVRYVPLGDGGVHYMGFHIADMILLGTGPWPDDTAPANSNSETTGSTSETAPQPGTGAGAKVDAQSALRLARQTLKKQSNG